MKASLVLCWLGLSLIGAVSGQTSGKEEAETEKKSPRYHSDKLFFQPAIHYSDDNEPALSGTGFYIVGPKKKLFAITSAHFFYFDSRQVDKVEWIGTKDSFKAGLYATSFGKPGRAGTDEPPDYREDFILFEHEGPEPDCLALQLNRKTRIMKGTNVWFPYRSKKYAKGWVKMDGIVTVASDKYIEITLSKEIDGMGRSGSPLLTHRHNQVVGLLVSGSTTSDGKMFLQFSPIGPVIKHLSQPQKKVLLSKYRSD
ncbi:MAG: hypothetical protein AAF514_22950 [Verrucomicrobiota bacterium]